MLAYLICSQHSKDYIAISGAYFFFAGLLLLLGGVGEFLLGNISGSPLAQHEIQATARMPHVENRLRLGCYEPARSRFSYTEVA
jgi:hypothetical protein